jgi:hypothetical protein
MGLIAKTVSDAVQDALHIAIEQAVLHHLGLATTDPK